MSDCKTEYPPRTPVLVQVDYVWVKAVVGGRKDNGSYFCLYEWGSDDFSTDSFHPEDIRPDPDFALTPIVQPITLQQPPVGTPDATADDRETVLGIMRRHFDCPQVLNACTTLIVTLTKRRHKTA